MPEAPVVTPTEQGAQRHAGRAEEQHDLGGAGDQELGEERCDALHSAGLGDDGAKRLGGQRTADHEGGEDRDRVTAAQSDAERARRHRLAAHGAAEGEGGQHDADADEEDDRIEARNVSRTPPRAVWLWMALAAKASARIAGPISVGGWSWPQSSDIILYNV